MAQTTVAMAGIASPHLLEPSLAPSSLPTHTSTSTNSKRPGFTPLLSVRSRHAAHTEDPSPSRRAILGLLAAPALLFVKDAQAASSIKVFGPPPPFGGLPGTENADQARDTDLPLKDRFYIQPLSPSEAAARAKESAKEIVNVKSLIEKKAWPYVQNDLRLRASYLRYDLNTIISTKAKDEKKALKSLTSKLFDTIDNLDYAARSKSLPKAQKYYAETVSALNDLLSKIA